MPSKNRSQICPKWTHFLILHNFCSTDAILMRLKYSDQWTNSSGGGLTSEIFGRFFRFCNAHWWVLRVIPWKCYQFRPNNFFKKFSKKFCQKCLQKFFFAFFRQSSLFFSDSRVNLPQPPKIEFSPKLKIFTSKHSQEIVRLTHDNTNVLDFIPSSFHAAKLLGQ